VNFALLPKNKSQIGYQILAYLVEYPKAQDTLEGIMEWWLLDRQIEFQTARVKKALFDLIAKEWIVELKGVDSRTYYRINQRKYEEIQQFFQHMGK